MLNIQSILDTNASPASEASSSFTSPHSETPSPSGVSVDDSSNDEFANYLDRESNPIEKSIENTEPPNFETQNLEVPTRFPLLRRPAIKNQDIELNPGGGQGDGELLASDLPPSLVDPLFNFVATQNPVVVDDLGTQNVAQENDLPPNLGSGELAVPQVHYQVPILIALEQQPAQSNAASNAESLNIAGAAGGSAAIHLPVSNQSGTPSVGSTNAVLPDVVDDPSENLGAGQTESSAVSLLDSEVVESNVLNGQEVRV